MYFVFMFGVAVLRSRLHIPGAEGQAPMAGRSTVQLQLREFNAHQLAMAENAADEDTRTQAYQAHRKGGGLNCIRIYTFH